MRHPAATGFPYAVWAPEASSVRLELHPADDHGASEGHLHELTRGADGWWTSLATVLRRHGDRYGFHIDDEGPLPDPRSPRQPEGVHGLSAVHDLDESRWSDGEWRGRPFAGSIIYELHVGTFTPEGTLDAACDRLDYLVDLGIDLVELMPLAGVNGTHNWGYDGVAWYTVAEHYGGPDALQRFVDAAHGHGLGVCLDVVYNHLGPSGNYLPRFGPYLSEGATSWGQGLNLDGPGCGEVREYIVDNALRWFREFHIDALRLDAVHALHDTSTEHLLVELARRTDTLSAHLGRPLTLIAESDENDPLLCAPRDAGGRGITAQWDDDIHHALHTSVSGEDAGYYADFAAARAGTAPGLGGLADVLTSVFFHRGRASRFGGVALGSKEAQPGYSSFRGRIHGRPVSRETTPAWRYVAYTLTHDQVGNRATGDRPSQNLPWGLQAVKAAVILLSPFTPMLFMGEEFGAQTPFAFFTSHPEPELARATAEGRIREFATLGWDPATVPDPQDPATFRSSVLQWSELDNPAQERLLDTYRALIAVRRERPEITCPWLVDSSATAGDGWLRLTRGWPGSGVTTLVINVSSSPLTVPLTTRDAHGPDAEVTLEWDCSNIVDDGRAVEVPAQSFSVLCSG